MLDQSLARPSLRIDPGLRLAPRLDEFRAPPGPITFPAAPDHRLRLYKGAPSRGTCGRLLLQARLPAAEIALATGFSHQSHMARCMRRILGLTPTALLRSAARP